MAMSALGLSRRVGDGLRCFTGLPATRDRFIIALGRQFETLGDDRKLRKRTNLELLYYLMAVQLNGSLRDAQFE